SVVQGAACCALFLFGGAGECPEIVRNCLKCGLLHSDPAVVGRKSGSPKSAHADICTIIMPDKEKTLRTTRVRSVLSGDGAEVY
ncbi:hypothetical protein, partial [Undibacterium luofuense]|uniref:hypothetical protein n=1 Tax=Undibacterium luofuense TaxID=2828733 RepID=UPI0030EE56DA